MKKLLFILIIVTLSVVEGQSQKGFKFYEYAGADTVNAYEILIIQGDTVKLNLPSSDGQVIKKVAGIWTNAAGGAGSAAMDSLTQFNFTTGYLGWYISGSVADSISLDFRYIEIADSAFYVTTTALNDSIANALQVTKNIYHISMPLGGGSVQDRIDVTTDLPPGWILTADGINLIVTHNLERRPFGVTVWGKTGGTVEQELYNTNRYTLIESPDSDNVKIYGLSLFPGEIVVRIAFE